MGLTYSEDKHEYKVDGLVIPSVTQIINNIFPISDFISKETLEQAADFGRKVHKATELYDEDKLDIDNLHPSLLPYLNGWIKFKKDFGFQILEIEQKYFHTLYKFAGKIDRVGIIRKDKILSDIKSGIKIKTHALQTAAYGLLYNQGKSKSEQIKKRMSVYLEENDYKIISHENKTDEQVFLSCLTIYNYKKRGNK